MAFFRPEREVRMHIRQHLTGAMERLDEVRRVCAHPQLLAQCRAWLRQHLPDVELEQASSNAAGARRACDESGTAAIAPAAAAEIYGLHVLCARTAAGAGARLAVRGAPKPRGAARGPRTRARAGSTGWLTVSNGTIRPPTAAVSS